MITNKKKKERDCYDKARKRILYLRRRRPIDAATSVALQLFAIFAVLLNRSAAPAMAPSDIPYSPPRPSPRTVKRADTAKHLGIPMRYLEVVQVQGKVPYAILFDHIRHAGVLRRDAMVELRKVAPADSLRWLDHIQMYDRWSDLLRCYVPNGTDEDTDVKLLKSTLSWLREIAPVLDVEAPVTVTQNCTPSSTSSGSKNDTADSKGPRL